MIPSSHAKTRDSRDGRIKGGTSFPEEGENGDKETNDSQSKEMLKWRLIFVVRRGSEQWKRRSITQSVGCVSDEEADKHDVL